MRPSLLDACYPFLSHRMYGHIKGMAESVKKGIDAIEGCEGVIYQVREAMGRRGAYGAVPVRCGYSEHIDGPLVFLWSPKQVQEPEPQLPLP